MKRSTIVVTGCAGFIGSNFVRQFSKKFKKYQIVGIDDLSTGKKSAVEKNIVFYKTSITNKKKIDEIFKKHKPEYVFHFAALSRVSYSIENPRKTSEVNIIGTINILEVSKKYEVKRFIFSSSSSVYGNTKKIPTKESEKLSPLSPYALQKYIGERFCKMFNDLFALDTVSLRYFNVFGSGQYGDSPYSTVISAWLQSIYNPNLKPYIEGDGKQSRDFCYIDDVVKANILAMRSKSKLNGEVINIGTRNKTNLNEVKNMIEKYIGRILQLEQRPSRLGDVRHTMANISKAKKLLRYVPRVSFETGLKKTVDWFENEYRK
jgi:UDP-glucose 4-epimerase